MNVRAPILSRFSGAKRPKPLGFTKAGRPILPIAGGAPDAPVVEAPTELDDAAKATVEAVIKATIEGLKTEMATATKVVNDDQIRQAAYAGGTSDINGDMKAWDEVIGLTKAWGRELHSCQDPDCQNKDHGIRAARFIKQQLMAKATGGMLEGTGSIGGFLVPADYHQDLIPLLRAKAVVRAIGTQIYPMPELITYIPRQSAAGSGSWSAEAGSITASNQTLEQLTLTAKRANALTFFSNEMLADATPQADVFVRNDLIKVIALLEDKAFLIGGAAVSGSPTGIYRNTTGNTFSVQSGVTSVDAGTAAVSYDNLSDAVNQLEQGNVDFVNPAWVMHGRDLGVIRKVKDGNGLPVFRDGVAVGGTIPVGMNRGEILGIPVYVSNQMPTNVGGASKSAIILGDFSQAVIGDRQQMEVAVSSEATVIDPDGSTSVNLFATNQSAIRVIERVDFQLRHPAAFCVITNLTT